MKTPEDEAFDDLARKQGAWGGGFPAKRAMAADKVQEDLTNYGTAWSQDGKRIDPTSVYKEQPVQEPVACVQDLDEVKRKHLVYEKGMDWKDPLYTTPPQREWVGLTAEEIASIPLNEYTLQTAERLLKDKNT